MSFDYTDQELRLIVLPHALALVNQDVYRALNQCNTTTINTLTTELVNIIKYNSVSEPEVVPASAGLKEAVKAKSKKVASPKFA